MDRQRLSTRLLSRLLTFVSKTRDSLSLWALSLLRTLAEDTQKLSSTLQTLKELSSITLSLGPEPVTTSSSEWMSRAHSDTCSRSVPGTARFPSDVALVDPDQVRYALDNRGKVFFWWFSDEYPEVSCKYCMSGECVQRVMLCAPYKYDSVCVEHNVQSELS